MYTRHRMQDWEHDQASCFALCDRNLACHQAVYETADSPWGAQCWLGTNIMTRLPDQNRTGGRCDEPPYCHDYCYSKVGWWRAESPAVAEVQA